jgi:hypothetical protein
MIGFDLESKPREFVGNSIVTVITVMLAINMGLTACTSLKALIAKIKTCIKRRKLVHHKKPVIYK